MQNHRNPRLSKPKHKRTRGSGSLIIRKTRAGEEVWYGKWYERESGRQTMRRIAPKSELSKTQAGKLLLAMMHGEPEEAEPSAGDSPTFAEAAEAHLDRLKNRGVKRSTIRGYESVLVQQRLNPRAPSAASDRSECKLATRQPDA